MNQISACKFLRKPASDLFELIVTPIAWIDCKRAFGASKGNVHKRAFQAHKRGKRFYLVLIRVGRVSDAAFYWFDVFAMHRAPTLKAMNSSSHFYAKAD